MCVSLAIRVSPLEDFFLSNDLTMDGVSNTNASSVVLFRDGRYQIRYKEVLTKDGHKRSVS